MDSIERLASDPEVTSTATVLTALLDEAHLAVEKQEPVDEAWIEAASGYVAHLIANANHDQLVTARTALRELTNAAYRSRQSPTRHQDEPIDGMIIQLRVLNSVTNAGEALLRSRAAGLAFEPGSIAARMLAALLATQTEVSARDLKATLDVHETQLSREGRKLLDLGLVFKHKYGREVSWSLTPIGREAARGSAAAPPAPTTPPVTVNTADEFDRAGEAAAECIAVTQRSRAREKTFYRRTDLKTPAKAVPAAAAAAPSPLIVTSDGEHLYIRDDLTRQPWAQELLLQDADEAQQAGAQHDAS